ncbi:Pollen Ole e 1 allergen/extensin [Heracleum sosnowskyi]|uniref:Pollen Ole e 1 allergen/extensin n=1 Tax=Heracleum sosnowskyi TaxID=360622 RepID=A0AAD8MJQ4_9APIA|nr:Pollen Ole e 1 allergen/extensin [Heracleum sosnowskyi]
MTTKPYHTLILFIYLLSVIQISQSQGSDHEFKVQGQVYCDVCRAQFITKLSTFMKGATVRLECRDRENDTQTSFSGEGTTDDTGTYHITVTGDHEDDICAIKLVKSPDSECSDISAEKFSRDIARVSLTKNSGIATNIRNANPIGFMKKNPHEECKSLLEELGVVPAH